MINILEYQYGSDKGSARNGQTFASPLAYQGMNPSYTASQVDGEVLAAEGGHYYLQYTPVKAGTVVVLKSDGTVVAGVSLVDANTGEITATTPGDLAGATAYYLYDNETIPVETPQIKLDIKSIPIQTQSRKLSAIWSFDAQYELSKELTDAA